MENENPGYFSRIKKWAAKPFQEEMDFWNWVLFTIFVVTVAILWMQVLKNIEPLEL